MPNIAILEEVQVVGGASIRREVTVTVEAVDSFEVTLPDAPASEVQVDLIPGLIAQAKVFMLKASGIPANDHIQVAFGDVAASATIVADVSDTFLLRGDAVQILADLDSLHIENATGGDVTVEVLIGRDATP